MLVEVLHVNFIVHAECNFMVSFGHVPLHKITLSRHNTIN